MAEFLFQRSKFVEGTELVKRVLRSPHRQAVPVNTNCNAPSTIRIAAALLVGANGRLLLVRKRGTLTFMQPGGKIEPGEPALAALLRELQEELGILVHPSEPVYMGKFAAPAANEPGSVVEADLFRLFRQDQIHPAAEIEEVRWIDHRVPTNLLLAPLTRDHVLSLHRALGDRPLA